MSLAIMMPPAEDAKAKFPKAGEYEPCGRTHAELIRYIKGFLNGGLPAIARLKQVLPSIFDYFKIIPLDEKADVLTRCGLTPYREDNDVTFFFQGTDCKDPLRAPDSVSYAWGEIKDSAHPPSPRTKEQVLLPPMPRPSLVTLTPVFERQQESSSSSPAISHSAPELGQESSSSSPAISHSAPELGQEG